MPDSSLATRIIAALKKGPISRHDLIANTFDYEIPEPVLDAAAADLIKAGKLRRFTNWPMYGGERVEYWTLTATGN